MHLFKNALDSLPSIDHFTGWHLLQKFRIPPPPPATAFYLYSIIKRQAWSGSRQQWQRGPLSL